ncbi:hypothetical protein GQX74_011325 [Glossina fuscipes]|nr:hypothetical protein GQX74_011325 [Glossina fuscipes]
MWRVRLGRIGLFNKKPTEYFMHLVLDAMKYRKENHIIRPDMINMLMEARGMLKSDNLKSHNREWSDIDIVGQCFLFAGFETAASLICLIAHEVMENPDVQEKLLQEIQDVLNIMKIPTNLTPNINNVILADPKKEISAYVKRVGRQINLDTLLIKTLEQESETKLFTVIAPHNDDAYCAHIQAVTIGEKSKVYLA